MIIKILEKIKNKIRSIKKARETKRKKAKACRFWNVCKYFAKNRTCLNDNYRIIHLGEVRCGQFAILNREEKKELKVLRELDFSLIDSKIYSRQ